MHVHSEHEVVLARQGEITILTDDFLLTTSAPCLILYKKYKNHAQFNHVTSNYERYGFQLSENPPAALLPTMQRIDACAEENVVVIPVSPSMTDWLFHVFKRVEELTKKEKIPDDDPRFLIPFSYLLEEIAYILESHVPIEKNLNKSKITDVLAYISAHLTEKLTLQDIASAVYISKTKLCTDFQKYMSVSVHQYIITERLALSVKLLRNGMSIEKIAQASGFRDAAHYIRTFKQVYGTTPSQFLKVNPQKTE